jgi:hypothetical protein
MSGPADLPAEAIDAGIKAVYEVQTHHPFPDVEAQVRAALAAALPHIRAHIADIYAVESKQRGAEKDYLNLSYQEGYLDALDFAERVARGGDQGEKHYVDEGGLRKVHIGPIAHCEICAAVSGDPE